MNMIYLLIFLISALFSSSCASTASEKLMTKSGNKGVWQEKASGYKENGKIYFTGISSRAVTEAEAIKKAETDALSQVSKYFGVEVNSTTTIKDRETLGNTSYDIGIKSTLTGTSIKLKNFAFEKKYIEKWQRKNIEYDAKVLLSIPIEEMSKIKTVIDNLCGWTINSEGKINEEMISQFVKEFAKIKKLNISPSKINFSKFGSEESIISNSDTAQFLLISVKDKRSSSPGEKKISLTLSVDLISVVDKKITDNFSAQSESSDISETKAEAEAYSNVFEQIYVQ